MHLAEGNISVVRSQLSEGVKGVDQTVAKMMEMAVGQYGARSAKIRALAINILNKAKVANKDYYGMIVAIGEWVRDHVRYVKDPVGQETLSYPEETAFNSLAGDCDDDTILVIGLLGSLGIRAYPVVVGPVPGNYSHVYAYAEVPPGSHRNAGKTIAVDAIMREWPIGKEAPADKVPAKKTYPHLSGLGAMTLGAYASGPSYLNEAQAAGVKQALARRTVDAGSYGEMFTTAKVQAGAEGVDSMFAMEYAPESKLQSRGPVEEATASGTVHFMGTPRTYDVGGTSTKRLPGDLRRNGLKTTRVIDAGNIYDRPFMGASKRTIPSTVKPAVSAAELKGLGDYLQSLESEARYRGCAGLGGTIPNDPLMRAAAAAHYAKKRARQARYTANLVKNKASKMVSGLSGPAAPQEARALVAIAKSADAVADAAETASGRAEQVADLVTGSSPQRQAQMNAARRRLEAIDNFYGLTDIIVQESDGGAHPYVATGANVLTLAHMVQILPTPVITSIVKPGLDTPMPKGSHTVDMHGQPVDQLYERVDLAGLGSFWTKARNAVTGTVKKVAVAPFKVVQKVAQVVKKNKFLALAASTLTLPIAAIAGLAKGVMHVVKKKNANAPGGETTSYVDANGNPITEAQYNAAMAAQSAPTQTTYLDASGNPITEAQYNAAMATSTAQPIPGPTDPSVQPQMYNDMSTPSTTSLNPGMSTPIPVGSAAQDMSSSDDSGSQDDPYGSPTGIDDGGGDQSAGAPPVDTFGPEDMSAPQMAPSATATPMPVAASSSAGVLAPLAAIGAAGAAMMFMGDLDALGNPLMGPADPRMPIDQLPRTRQRMYLPQAKRGMYIPQGRRRMGLPVPGMAGLGAVASPEPLVNMSAGTMPAPPSSLVPSPYLVAAVLAGGIYLLTRKN